ncbi:HAMP domain-containing sensor histidine kinase [Nocardiopsis sp. CNT312]|uniref:sensor histidine kinase n=1 Tax=Nocardiopsis sp. CNT312 TaxID=1137268 RepID=UPI0005613C49|nr:HAMP domain-containing sensor histidine kinase [Nocardiopsis sp. CNT312]
MDHARRLWNSKRPRSIRARVTLWSVAVLFVLLTVLFVVFIIVLHTLLVAQQAVQADAAARAVVEDIGTERYAGDIPPYPPIGRLQIVDARTYEVLAASAAMRGAPAVVRPPTPIAGIRMETTVCTIRVEDEREVCFVVVVYEALDTAYGDDVLVIASTPEPAIVSTNAPEALILGTGVLLLAISGSLTWYGVGRALRPVEEIRLELERLSASDLDRRVPVPRTRDEIAHLARTANDSIERVSESVTKQRRFVSDASHELRNPIAGMRTRLEVELSEPEPDPRERERLLWVLLDDTERLEGIVDDLLEMARLDAGLAMSRESLDLSELVRQETGQIRGGTSVEVHAGNPVLVSANRLRLVRVLTNLVANAERHARSRIVVAVGCEGGRAVVRVHDDGRGVPEEDRERVFERFARLRESRERDPGGSGLGLTISREIARDHGGTLTVGDSPLLGGAVFTLMLPAEPGRPG